MISGVSARANGKHMRLHDDEWSEVGIQEGRISTGQLAVQDGQVHF